MGKAKEVSITFRLSNIYLGTDKVKTGKVAVESAVANIDVNGIATVKFHPYYSGQYRVRIDGDDFRTEAVGPAIGAEGSPDRLWRPMTFFINLDGTTVKGVARPTKKGGVEWGTVKLVGANTVDVQVQPVWMKAKSQKARAGVSPRYIILHNTAGTMKGDIKLFTKDAASIHYLVARDGQVIKGVHESRRAWHCGVNGGSEWRGERDLDDHTVGIEISRNPRDPAVATITEAQYASLVPLLESIISSHDSIERHAVLAHSDIRDHYRYRLECPGPDFDWARLRSKTIGLGIDETVLAKAEMSMRFNQSFDGFTNELPGCFFDDTRDCLLKPKSQDPAILRIQQDLRYIGYKTPITGKFDTDTGWAIQQFYFHFIPGAYTENEDGSRTTLARRSEVSLDTILTIRAVRRWCEVHRDSMVCK